VKACCDYQDGDVLEVSNPVEVVIYPLSELIFSFLQSSFVKGSARIIEVPIASLTKERI
jgi:hypothetical protein